MRDVLKVFEAFAGVGSQRMALRNLGIEHEVVCISEIDKYAIASYEAIHGVTKNLGDISKIKTEDIPDHDLFTYSFPCFTKDNIVLTTNGYKYINEILVGDEVLTHDNTFQKVVKVFNNGTRPIIKVKGKGIDEITTTKNHKFYLREYTKTWNNKKRVYRRSFSTPDWIEVGKLKSGKKYYMGMAINQNSNIPKWNGIEIKWMNSKRIYKSNIVKPLLENGDFWWLIGRYVADGWTKKQSGFVIAVGHKKVNEFEEKVGQILSYTKSKERTAIKYHFNFKELNAFVDSIGHGAKNKQIPGWIIDLPISLLKSFLDGYMSGDGCYTNGIFKACTVSRKLAYGIGQCIMKVYKRPYSLYKTKVGKTTIIENRIVNQNDTYEVTFKKTSDKQDKAFYENGYVWTPLKQIIESGEEEVYDIEVENNHSFTVQNVIVHNCQDISVAGLQKGLDIGSGTRSGLLWECQKVIAIKKPKYLLLENVKNLVGKKHRHNFDKWLEWLEEQGYTNYWKVLNAKDYGIPQNRERVFVVSILGEHKPYVFPQKQELKLRLKDVLEENVDEKYYLTNDKAAKLIATIQKENEITSTTPVDGGLKNPKVKEISNVIKARYDAGISNQQSDGTLVIEPTSQRIGGIFDTEKTKHQAGAVWDKEQLAPTLDTMQGGWRQPSILIKNATKQGYLEAREYDGVVIGSTQKNAYVGDLTYSPTLTSAMGTGGGHVPMIGAARGRNPENPTSREVGLPTEQMLEINKKGTSNCITTVQKDNLVVESKSEFGRMGKQAVETLNNNEVEHGNTINPFNKTVDKSELSPTLTTRPEGFKTAILPITQDLRIRKLTPKECWRLMGFTDGDFEKAQKVVSNSQLYKQAGNSIVVKVLEGIFRNLFMRKTDEEIIKEGQISMF